MTDDIIDSRGRFWSAEIAVPDGHFAPEESVTGRLRVRANGRAELDLDATIDLSGSKDAVHRILSYGEVEGAICGFLIDANKHVRLTGLSGNGGSLGGIGPIYERLVANRCLVSRERFKPGREPRFRWLDLPLNGYEEWIGRGSIDVAKGRRRVSAHYAVQATPMRWQAAAMPLELHQGLQGDGGKALTELAWRETAFLRLGFPKADLTVEQAIDLSQRIEDLIVLMADHNQRLEFGLLRHSKKGNPVQFYFTRSGRDTLEKLQWHKAWARFDQCSDQFGDVVSSWLAKYETYGPGFHLYLGNRRGQAMYYEHRFASLMWGLESLHRAMVPAESNAAQAAKVARILDQISLKKDRNWAERFLPEQSEPSLANRLVDLFSRLDLGIDRQELATFAQRCARRRNDVSHFGGQRQAGDYDAFLEDIANLSGAVDLLYHALILHITGVPDWLVKRRFIGGPHSYAACAVLAHCGLLVPEPNSDQLNGNPNKPPSGVPQ
ncbi:MAG: hypothetical protein PSY12_13340 [bacterium]|nr:hypothetical protein [bacterium]